LAPPSPTKRSTHQVAQAIAPESQVVYVDYDRVVLAHARALLTSTREGACAYLDADARDTDKVTGEARRVLDFDQPVAVIMVGVLHLLPDSDDPWGLVARLLSAVPPESWLAVVHPTSDVAPDQMAAMTERYNKRVATAATMRTHAEVSRFFSGLELLPPGIVQLHRWQPGRAVETSDEIAAYCGLGRKA
jgi:tRNA A58 N-methylase Trm61